jgi:hypothetical protein
MRPPRNRRFRRLGDEVDVEIDLGWVGLVLLGLGAIWVLKQL